MPRKALRDLDAKYLLKCKSGLRNKDAHMDENW